MTAIIQAEKLTKFYGQHRGIVEVDLEVSEGEAFGFLGPNGAGKTTMIRTLLDHIRPTSGKASIFGIDDDRRPRCDPSPARLPAGRVRAVRQADRRPDDRILREPARRRRPGLPGRADRRLDIDPTRKFKEYSKGNKQKIGLVVALQHRPDLLLLDEPTSGLDPLVQQTFFDVIREAKAEGRTVFLSSHILSEVEKTCDRVAIIRDGRLARVDRVEALRDMAHHQVELRFAASSAGGRVRGAPRSVRGRRDRPHHHDARVRADHAGRPRRGAHEVIDFVSREPSLEETFLAEYGRSSTPAEAA